MPNSKGSIFSSLFGNDSYLYSKNKIALVTQHNNFYDDLSVKVILKFFCLINGIKFDKLGEFLKFFEFDGYLDNYFDELSSGNQRKLLIIISLMRDPNLVIFDEATSGVDIIMRHKLVKLMNQFKKRNELVSMYTTHFLKDVELFCDKITIMDKGNQMFIGGI